MTFPYTNAPSGAGSTIKIGRAFGIDLRMHRLFPWMMVIVVLWFVSRPGSGPPLATALSSGIGLSLVFGLVVLHELGHALVARHFGIRVLDIVLWPLGGMARMEAIPENSRVEGLVAIAGPLVNLGLASAGIVALMLLFGPGVLSGAGLPPTGLSLYLGWFVLVNLMLGLFNLVPAFPMDGGRLLRAWLGRKGDYLRATELAVKVGRVCAWVMILAVIPTRNFFLALIGLYVLYAGSRELLMMRLRHGVPPFGGRGLHWPAGGSAAGNPLTNLWRAAIERKRPAHPQSPGGAATEGDGDSSAGYSEQDVARLEQLRSRLKRPGSE